MLPCLLGLEQAVDAHGEDRDGEILGEHADARTEGEQVAVRCVAAFGENEDAVSAVDGLAGVSEAAAESGFARKRKEIEERDAEEPLEAVVELEEEVSVGGRRAESFESFASGGNGEAVAETRGESGEDEAGIDVADVVGDDEQRACNAVEIVASFNAGPA